MESLTLDRQMKFGTISTSQQAGNAHNARKDINGLTPLEKLLRNLYLESAELVIPQFLTVLNALTTTLIVYSASIQRFSAMTERAVRKNQPIVPKELDSLETTALTGSAPNAAWGSTPLMENVMNVMKIIRLTFQTDFK